MPRAHSRRAWPSGRPNFWSSSRPIWPTGPSPTTVSGARTSIPGIKPSVGTPDLSTPWSARRMPCDFLAGDFLESAVADWGAGPDLHQAGGHQLRADPLVELADGEDQAAVFVEEGWGPGEFEGVVSYARPACLKGEGKNRRDAKAWSGGWRRWDRGDRGRVPG